MPRFSISAAAFDVAPLRSILMDVCAGAFVTFEGWVRNHHQGRPVHGLHYQAYAALAESEGETIMHEALACFAIQDVRCVHRVGALLPGDLAVWVGVSSAHREAAFAACRYIIDEVKQRVPIWKQEHYADGGAGWLHPVNDPAPEMAVQGGGSAD